MKKFIYVLVGVLVVWNIFLTFEIFNQPQNNTTIEHNVVETTITGYTTDITQTVEECEEKVVTIENYQDDVVDSVGSGIVYDYQQGEVYIVTNYHVIEGSQRVNAIFANGANVELTLVGYDENYDVALLKAATDFNVEPFVHGDTNLLKKGEYAIAIGSPIAKDFAGSVTFGVISGKDLLLSVDSDNDGIYDADMVLLQTDVAMNVGNSGGALVNLNGELIGLNTLGLTGSNVQGMNFAIPINELAYIVEQLMENGIIERGYLGISGEDVANLENYEKSYLNLNLELNEGYLIKVVETDGPAYNAGLQVNDIIVAINDQNVSDYAQIRDMLYHLKPQDTIEITYLRNNIEETCSVVLG